MNNILILTLTNLKRNKMALVLSVAGGILLCLMLTLIGNLISVKKADDISIGFIDYNHSRLSDDFRDYLIKDLHYKLIENRSYYELCNKLVEKKISVIVEVPCDFDQSFVLGRPNGVSVIALDDYENTAYVKMYISSYLRSIELLSKNSGNDTKTFDRLLADYQRKGIPITQKTAAEPDIRTVAGQQGFMNSIGFYLMFLFGICTFLSYMVVDDRINGVYHRIQISPVKAIEYIVGTGILGIMICLPQIIIYNIYIYCFQINTGIPAHDLVPLMSLYAVFTVCFSIAIAVILISKKAILSIIMGFATVGCILGGAYFPIDLAPKAMKNLARVLPQYWFMDALRKVQTDVHVNIYPNMVIIALFALLCLLIGAVYFAQNYKSS